MSAPCGCPGALGLFGRVDPITDAVTPLQSASETLRPAPLCKLQPRMQMMSIYPSASFAERTQKLTLFRGRRGGQRSGARAWKLTSELPSRVRACVCVSNVSCLRALRGEARFLSDEREGPSMVARRRRTIARVRRGAFLPPCLHAVKLHACRRALGRWVSLGGLELQRRLGGVDALVPSAGSYHAPAYVVASLAGSTGVCTNWRSSDMKGMHGSVRRPPVDF